MTMTMKKAWAVAMACGVMAVTGAAFGKSLKNESAAFVLEVPDNHWVEARRGDVLVLEHKDRTMLIEVIGHPNQTMTRKAAAYDTGYATGLLGGALGEVKLHGAAKETQHNGMPCVTFAGVAKNRDGKTVDFGALTCKTAEHKGVTAVMFAVPAHFAEHKASAQRIFESLKPIP